MSSYTLYYYRLNVKTATKRNSLLIHLTFIGGNQIHIIASVKIRRVRSVSFILFNLIPLCWLLLTSGSLFRGTEGWTCAQ